MRRLIILAILFLPCFFDDLTADAQGATGPAFDSLDVSGAIKTQIGTSILRSGAACDGATDDTASINTYLATLTSGGLVYVPSGKMCLINSANLSVPDNVVLTGASSPLSPQRAYTLSGTTGFVLNPLYTISMGQGAQLRDLFIRTSGMIANPSTAQAIAAVTAWGVSSSVGVTVPPNNGGVRLVDLFIEGFNTGIKASAGQLIISDVWLDNYNGVAITRAADNTYIDNVRAEPFYALNTNANNGGWARPGIAFNLYDGNTGTTLTRTFSFMYASGLVVASSGGITVSDSGYEWQNSFGNGLTGTTGIRFLGHVGGVKLSHNYSTTFAVGLSVESWGNFIANGNDVTGSTSTGAYLAGVSATPSIVTITGTPVAGDTASVTLTSASIAGSPVTYTYTVVAGDTTTTIASALVQSMTHANALITARVFATDALSNALTVYWPGSLTVGVTSGSTGGTVTAVTTGSALPGSYGVLASLDDEVSGLPAITAGDATGLTGAWNIISPHVSSGGVPTGWLYEPKASEHFNLTFAGVYWSPNPSVTACGTGSPVASGNDADGVVFVGAGTVTSCTVTFHTAFPGTPAAIQITPGTSGVLTTVTAFSATGFTVTFAASAPSSTFYYHVTP